MRTRICSASRNCIPHAPASAGASDYNIRPVDERRIAPIWWSQTGSNRRPPACKAGALPAELWPLPGLRSAFALLRPGTRSTDCLAVVGLGGLEPPTSRLSSARSNQLSYKPGSEGSEQTTEDRILNRLSSVVRNPSPDKARPRRKRNVDGGVPQIRARDQEREALTSAL